MCERGGKRWTCLVEVKTGSNTLKDEQVGRYLDIAREQRFDGVLTISNQITHSASESPVCVDGRRLRKAKLWHFSWWRVLTEAVVQSRHRGVSDPDQAWVLRELIHYLSSDASGATGFEDMGEYWVPVRSAAHDGTLRQGDVAVRHVAEHWEQFIQYLCLSFSQELGRNVVSLRPRKQTTSARLEEVSKSLATLGTLQATIRIPDAIGDMQVRADLNLDRRPSALMLVRLRKDDPSPVSTGCGVSCPRHGQICVSRSGIHMPGRVLPRRLSRQVSSRRACFSQQTSRAIHGLSR